MKVYNAKLHNDYYHIKLASNYPMFNHALKQTYKGPSSIRPICMGVVYNVTKLNGQRLFKHVFSCLDS